MNEWTKTFYQKLKFWPLIWDLMQKEGKHYKDKWWPRFRYIYLTP